MSETKGVVGNLIGDPGGLNCHVCGESLRLRIGGYFEIKVDGNSITRTGWCVDHKPAKSAEGVQP